MQDKIAQTAKPTYNQEDIYGGLSPTLQGVHPWEYQRSSGHQRNYMKAHGNNGRKLLTWPPPST